MRSSIGFFVAVLAVALIPPSHAQNPGTTTPTEGLRDSRLRVDALENVQIAARPRETPYVGTILVSDGQIIAVGKDVAIPPTARRHDYQGKFAYAGFIDAYSEIAVPDPPRDAGAPHWNGNLMPQRTAAAVAGALGDAGKLRSQGITMRVVAPEGGILRGSSALVLCSDGNSRQVLVAPTAWQHLTLTVPRGRGAAAAARDSYPNSPMGATALVRQAFHDARWYREALGAFRADSRLPRVENDSALEALATAIDQSVFVFDAANERMAQRAAVVAQEFNLRAILRGSGREYRQLAEIVRSGLPILLPVDFPDPPKITTASAARETTLVDLMHWHFAPSNPGRLASSGVTLCLTSDGLKDPSFFLKQIRAAVEAGLTHDDALAAVTTNPAKLLGVEHLAGTIAPGRIGNLVITDKPWLDQDAAILETWIAGESFKIAAAALPASDPLAGDWELKFDLPQQATPTAPPLALKMSLLKKEKEKGIEGVLRLAASKSTPTPPDAPAPQEEGQKAAEPQTAPSSEEQSANAEPKEEKKLSLDSMVLQRDRLTARIDLSELGGDLPAGNTFLAISYVISEAQFEVIDVALRLPDGRTVPGTAAKIAALSGDAPSGDTPGAAPGDTPGDTPGAAPGDTVAAGGDTAAASDTAAATPQPTEEMAAEAVASAASAAAADAGSADGGLAEEPQDRAPEITLVYPLGASGLTERPAAPAAVLFRGATLWTCGLSGIIEQGEVLVVDGKIAAVGTNLPVPEGCEILDLAGKHLTPGLIDCHSHMATDGGVNESGQGITAEVRIGDFLDPTDISIYRQLAGGLTTANILHGSANPIGGQNQVIKLRWGGTMDDLRFAGAPLGIKFALGENVKRRTGRYPNTRMGVEQILRDQLLAAREYAAAHRRYRQGDRTMLPPRVDLQLEALAEIVSGDRWIHCHSYRQDEIVALLDVLDEFQIRIGSLQHILEGYKVADRMLAHGATASSFSDWWAYKFEVYNAIPYNGALMHDVGIVVSFNSDDAELARHMNTEAAKAVKYGGVPPSEALKFVTLNPAKQLRIDHRVGSLEAGKDADLVVWSGPPLSTMTRCEQTWIDGRCYFSLEIDAALRARDAAWHAALVQEVIEGKRSTGGARQSRQEEEDRWHRHDIFCGHHDHLEDRHEAEDYDQSHQIQQGGEK